MNTLKSSRFLRGLLAVIPVLAFVACSHGKIVEEQPLKEKLGQFKRVGITATSSAPKGQNYIKDLSSLMMKRLVKAKVFETVSPDESNSDLIIKGDIIECTVPEGLVTWDKMKAKVRYTLIAKNGNKVLGSFQTETDANGKTSVGGFSNSDQGYVFGRSADHLVKYLQDHI